MRLKHEACFRGEPAYARDLSEYRTIWAILQLEPNWVSVRVQDIDNIPVKYRKLLVKQYKTTLGI